MVPRILISQDRHCNKTERDGPRIRIAGSEAHGACTLPSSFFDVMVHRVFETPVKRSIVHELSIAQSLLEIVLEESARNRLKQVHVIRLQVGAMAAVVPEALTFCFDMLSENSIAQGASMEIETLPVVARCSRCDLPFQVENQVFLCPKCGDPTLELVSGRELSVVSIEGETGDCHDPDYRARGAQHSAGQ